MSTMSTAGPSGASIFLRTAFRPASYYTGFNGGPYGSGEQNTGFQAFNAVQQAATASILNMYSAVANVTFTQIAETSTQSATCATQSRIAEHGLGLLSFESPEGGDAWFNSSSGWYDNPVVGNYAWLTIMHETGHLLGLKHPQDASGSFGAVPVSADSLEYTGDELPLLYRGVDHAGPHQRDLELSADADAL